MVIQKILLLYFSQIKFDDICPQKLELLLIRQQHDNGEILEVEVKIKMLLTEKCQLECQLELDQCEVECDDEQHHDE
jgi:hypothetical protein